MKTYIVDIKGKESNINIYFRCNNIINSILLLIPDGVEIIKHNVNDLRTFGDYSSIDSTKHARKIIVQKSIVGKSMTPIVVGSNREFPPRSIIESTIIQIIKEAGGNINIRDEVSGWTIYDEIAARLGVSLSARKRLTEGTAEPAWRPEVGYARKNLEQKGIIAPTATSGRGVWTLSNRYAP